MRNEKPTPGPWKFVVGADARVVCPDGRSFLIGDAIYHPENVANARLIATSPDLLAACEEAVAAFDCEVPEGNPTMQRLRDAIARARG